MLTSGRWYYEVTIGVVYETLCQPRFGWRDEPSVSAGERRHERGRRIKFWGVDGVCKKKEAKVDMASIYDGDYGMAWKEGDVLGCLADLDAKTLSFSLNGSTDAPMGVAFEGIGFEGSLFPALRAEQGLSISAAFAVSCNFGEDFANPLKHLPDGYSPIVPSRGECGDRMWLCH